MHKKGQGKQRAILYIDDVTEKNSTWIENFEFHLFTETYFMDLNQMYHFSMSLFC